jgi:hypothetical protein
VTGELVERCRADLHYRTLDNVTPLGKCKRCRKLAQTRWYARSVGAPLCPNGHGLIGEGVAPDGSCVECAAPAGEGPRLPPPPDIWLDWAAVHRALQGGPLVRPLTKYETLCALTTVARRNLVHRAEAAGWLRENTEIAIPADNGEFLALVWARRRGLRALTVSEAVVWVNEPDTYVAACAGELDELDEDAA